MMTLLLAGFLLAGLASQAAAQLAVGPVAINNTVNGVPVTVSATSYTTVKPVDNDIVDLGAPTRAELHFLDPDGNQLELVAWDYPMDDRANRGRYDAWQLFYSWGSWPPAD